MKAVLGFVSALLLAFLLPGHAQQLDEQVNYEQLRSFLGERGTIDQEPSQYQAEEPDTYRIPPDWRRDRTKDWKGRLNTRPGVKPFGENAEQPIYDEIPDDYRRPAPKDDPQPGNAVYGAENDPGIMNPIAYGAEVEQPIYDPIPDDYRRPVPKYEPEPLNEVYADDPLEEQERDLGAYPGQLPYEPPQPQPYQPPPPPQAYADSFQDRSVDELPEQLPYEADLQPQPYETDTFQDIPEEVYPPIASAAFAVNDIVDEPETFAEGDKKGDKKKDEEKKKQGGQNYWQRWQQKIKADKEAAAKRKEFYNKKVVKAEKFEMLSTADVSLGNNKLTWKQHGVVVTLEDGSKWLIRKPFGWHSRPSIQKADTMTEAWTATESKEVKQSKLGHYVRAAAGPKSWDWDSALKAANRMMALE